jgi:Family of unknown function (DUF6263)
MAASWLRSATVLVLLTASLSARAEEAVNLRWRFTKGQELKYLLRHKEVRTVELGDHQFETTTTSEYELLWTVVEVDDRGTATLSQKLTALRVTISGKDFDFQYDSARGNAADDEYKRKLVALYDQLRFADYQLEIEATGRVRRVQGFDRLLGELGDSRQQIDFHGLNLHDGAFGWFLQQALGQVPAAPATKGQRWEVPVDAQWEGIGHLTGRTTYTLAGPVEAGGVPCQEVEATGKQNLELDMKWFNQALRGPLRTTKLTGKVHVDAKAGRVQDSEVHAALEGRLQFGGGDKPADMKVKFEHTLGLTARR